MAKTTEKKNDQNEQIPMGMKLDIQNILLLVVELVWLSLLAVCHVLIAIYRKISPPPGKSLAGQVVLVTGGGSGLGKGLALEFANEGCTVAVADIYNSTAEETAAEIVRRGGVAKAYFINVAKLADVKELRVAVTADLGPVDILVNNAGLLRSAPLAQEEDDIIRTVLEVNLLSHFWMVREFLPSMKERNFGHIVAISSTFGIIGNGGSSVYSASKFGVRGFMDSLRQELESKALNKIKTTTVFPYFINMNPQYMKHVDIRIPPVTKDEAIKAIMNGVKREEVSVTIPGYLYPAMHIMRLMPEYIFDKMCDIFRIKINPVGEEEKGANTTEKIIRDLTKKDML